MSNDADRNIRWGFLSTANIAGKVKRAVDLSSNSEVIAIASRTEEKAQTWKDEHGVERAYGTYDALLEDDGLDAIYIGLPPSMHAEWTIKAAEHGKHVLCEKPLSANAHEAEEMAEACRRNGVQLMDGVMWVHHERTSAMKEIISSGALGDFRKMTAAFTINLGEQLPEGNIRLKKELAGGGLGDLGYYCIRAILWAFDSMPNEVTATARYHKGVDINLSAMLLFEDGKLASFDCAYDTATRKWFEVAGTKASLVCDDFVLPGKEESSRFWMHPPVDEKSEHTVGECVQETLMIEHFADAVLSGGLNECWPQEAINAMKVCDAVLESAARNERVAVS